ncbi:MAG: hypothetical protein DME21_11265 [Verrucomicrobia bacterium]|nr:MAG: hypothetical protein DME21_11265 [Verrucomicrobiota bacterium]
MRRVWTEILRGELIDITPVRAAEAGQCLSLHSADRLERAWVFPAMNLGASICEREHPTAAVPAGGKIVEGLVPSFPTDSVLAIVDIVFMDVQEHAQLRTRPACNVATLQKNGC